VKAGQRRKNIGKPFRKLCLMVLPLLTIRANQGTVGDDKGKCEKHQGVEAEGRSKREIRKFAAAGLDRCSIGRLWRASLQSQALE